MSYCYFYYLAWGPGLGGSRQGNQEPSLTFEPTVLEFIIRGYDLKRQGTAFLSSLSFPHLETEKADLTGGFARDGEGGQRGLSPICGEEEEGKGEFSVLKN